MKILKLLSAKERKDYLRNEFILAQSLPRNKVIGKIESIAREVNEPILKCYLEGKDGPHWNHWIKDEISTWFQKINTLTCKHNNKPLEADKIKEIFTEEDLDSPSNLKRIEEYVAQFERLKQKKESGEKLWKRFDAFYSEICPLISNYGNLSPENIRKLIIKHFC